MRITTCGLAFLLTLAGCGGTTWINKDLKERTRPSQNEVLILPVEAHRFPDTLATQVRRQLAEEVLKAFSDFGQDGSRLRGRLEEAGFGNIHWQLAQGMYLRGRHHRSGELTGEGYEWLRGLGQQAERFLLWATQTMGMPAPAPGALPRLRYLVACYGDRFDRSESPKTGVHLHLRVTCGIYDGHRQSTVATTWETHRLRPTAEAMKEALTGVGARLRQAMVKAGL